MVAKMMKLAVVPVLLAAASVIGGAPAAVARSSCLAWDGVQPPGSNGEELAGVTVLPSCVAWAVGSTPIQQINGSSWAAQSSQPPGARSLLAVAATSASNAWAVGTTGLGHVHAVIEHWDGTSWTPQQAAQPAAMPHPNVLVAVTAKSDSDAWAVGYYGTSSGRRTLTEHWNGTRWSRVPSPSPNSKGRNSQLTGVAITSARNVWAVGFYQTPKSGEASLILHWNGKSWQQMPSANPAHDTVLTSVTATTVSHAWAVGYAGDAVKGTGGGITQTLFLQWDGHSWTRIPSPNLIPFGENRLIAVTATQDSNIWAVGYDQRPESPVQGLILHWDGIEWQVPTVPESNTDGAEWLTSVAATAQDNVWAVGFLTPSSTPKSPLIIHFNGQSWQS